MRTTIGPGNDIYRGPRTHTSPNQGIWAAELRTPILQQEMRTDRGVPGRAGPGRLTLHKRGRMPSRRAAYPADALVISLLERLPWRRGRAAAGEDGVVPGPRQLALPRKASSIRLTRSVRALLRTTQQPAARNTRARNTRAPSAGRPSRATRAAGSTPAATLLACLSIVITAPVTMPPRAAAGPAIPRAAARPTSPAGPHRPAAPGGGRRHARCPRARTGTRRRTGPGHLGSWGGRLPPRIGQTTLQAIAHGAATQQAMARRLTFPPRLYPGGCWRAASGHG